MMLPTPRCTLPGRIAPHEVAMHVQGGLFALAHGGNDRGCAGNDIAAGKHAGLGGHHCFGIGVDGAPFGGLDLR